jgi:tyrosine-protein phosphatase SIW14
MLVQGIKKSGRRLRLVTVTLCMLAQLATVSEAQDSQRIEPPYEELPNFHRVNARLYRGGQPRKQGGIRKLAALGVKTIINLRDDDERARIEGREAEAAGLRYFNIPFGRLGRPTDEQVERVLSLIDAVENGMVFVHCARGSDRTGTAIAVYRIARDGWTSKQAKQEAKRYGMGFWQRGMKDYIHDYDRQRAPRANPAPPGANGKRRAASLARYLLSRPTAVEVL